MSKDEDLEQLFNTMMQLGKLMAQQTQESQEERAATMLQFSALNYIKDKGNATLTDVAAFLKLSKSSATQLIERLVVLNEVERTIDQNDKRVIRLTLTQKGSEELGVMKKKFIATLKSAFADIPKNDILELIRIHTNMIASLKQKKYE